MGAKSTKEFARCPWAQGDLYEAYHDNEWGKPCYDAQRLFEKLCLEGQQAGLSWITVLKKRENYRQRFANFEPTTVANMSDEQLEDCLTDSGLIRNRLKIFSIRKNAHAYLTLTAQGIDFSDWLWQFVEHHIHVNTFQSMQDVPTETKQSQAMSKSLKKQGFSFVGPTICYAFMQSMGMVGDHLINCPNHPHNAQV